MELEGYGSESSASSSLSEVGMSAPPVDRYPVSYAGKCHQRELTLPPTVTWITHRGLCI